SGAALREDTRKGRVLPRAGPERLRLEAAAKDVTDAIQPQATLHVLVDRGCRQQLAHRLAELLRERGRREGLLPRRHHLVRVPVEGMGIGVWQVRAQA